MVRHAGESWRPNRRVGLRPGGSCQLLLSRGLHVTGIDPAAMHPDVLANPHFTHLRKRAADVRGANFATPAGWLPT